MATWTTMTLQDAASPTMEQMIFFHDHTMMILLMITVMVSYMMSSTFINKLTNRLMLEGQTIEAVWTMLPAVILVFIAMPSLRLLYMMDEVIEPALTIKSIGHQWYWSYEYSDFKHIEFDSYMKPMEENSMNQFRLLEVDNRTVVPADTPVRLMITAADVLHSWAVPSLGIKIDATPGRLNQGMMNITRPGMMYGQCSEICGMNHSFMPIVIESVPINVFLAWIKSY
uniref:Cytochrome c oxidase subunit 2 n=1 Tax=Aradus compar TaxID=1176475 RepID=A0A172DYU9_9HEMI|nr:cytochrome c oxidase subunit II [Aradus compar]AFI54697.1 cytochrome c oxidase subunit II [Aradus compar]